jgi:hypothetical protein
MKKSVLIALIAKVAILTKAVLLGAVLLAKKALAVSVLSLFLSAMTASKKTTAPNSNKGEHKYRRSGTINYLDHNSDDPLSHTKQWVKSQEYHTQFFPNFIQDHEGNYNRNSANYGSFAPSRYTTRHYPYDVSS